MKPLVILIFGAIVILDVFITVIYGHPGRDYDGHFSESRHEDDNTPPISIFPTSSDPLYRRIRLLLNNSMESNYESPQHRGLVDRPLQTFEVMNKLPVLNGRLNEPHIYSTIQNDSNEPSQTGYRHEYPDLPHTTTVQPRISTTHHRDIGQRDLSLPYSPTLENGISGPFNPSVGRQYPRLPPIPNFHDRISGPLSSGVGRQYPGLPLMPNLHDRISGPLSSGIGRQYPGLPLMPNLHDRISGPLSSGVGRQYPGLPPIPNSQNGTPFNRGGPLSSGFGSPYPGPGSELRNSFSGTLRTNSEYSQITPHIPRPDFNRGQGPTRPNNQDIFDIPEKSYDIYQVHHQGRGMDQIVSRREKEYGRRAQSIEDERHPKFPFYLGLNLPKLKR